MFDTKEKKTVSEKKYSKITISNKTQLKYMTVFIKLMTFTFFVSVVLTRKLQ